MNYSLTHNLVDLHSRETYVAKVTVVDGKIQKILRLDQQVDPQQPFLMPGFVDAHIHIESSMLLPDQFARIAVTHGTVATVSDPHEIANVCGVEGIELMLRNAAQTSFKFCFGAPACVPATEFETAGARIDAAAVTQLLDDPRIGYLSEVMDFPGVLNRAPAVMAKINAAISRNKPVDGHAPGLTGELAARYVAAGITTDHECFTLDEALDKLKVGCKIAIREGSAARNFDSLESLIDSHPEMVMLCSDDKHPDEFLLGHINQLAARAVANGRDLMKVLRAACINPVDHYRLKVGLLREGDPADFILVEDLKDFKTLETYLDGTRVAQSGKCLMSATSAETVNNFVATPIRSGDLALPAAGKNLRLIDAIDGQLITDHSNYPTNIRDGLAVADVDQDILKIVVINRYGPAEPAIAFVRGFGLKSGAFASSVAHDSHNIVAVGTNDIDLAAAINSVIEERGGLSVSADGQTDILPLPVAGLMSTESCEWVAERYEKLDQRVKSFGSILRAPFMTLSFMALLVIPSLKLSDKGLFDGDNFVFTSVFVD